MNAEKISLVYIHVHFARECTIPQTKSCYQGQLQSIISNGKGKLKPRVNVRPQQLACMPTNNVYHKKYQKTAHESSTTAQHINFLILKFWACNCAMN